jgi:MoaA/NifB/PqqE/SkfB family radical SAM enzyme
MAQVRANFRDLKRLGVFVIDVTGGEPLLYRYLVEMLGLAKKMRFMTTVTTNGMLYPRYAQELVGKVDALLFSIDSSNADEHDRIRAVKSFDQALESLAVARRLRQALYISHVVTNESFDHLDEMIRFAKDQRAILYLNPCFSFFGNEGLDPEKAKRLVKYFGQPGVIIDRAQLSLIASGGNDIEDPVCRAVSSTVVISPENQLLLPCYHFKNDAIPIENNLYDLYKDSPVVQRAKKLEGRYSFCQGCTVYCYMRSSLLWKYPVDSVLLAGHYVRERVRQRLRTMIARSEPSPPPRVALRPATNKPVRRSLPVLSGPVDLITAPLAAIASASRDVRPGPVHPTAAEHEPTAGPSR